MCRHCARHWDSCGDSLMEVTVYDPGTPHLIINEVVGEPGGLQSMGSQRVGHDCTHRKLKKVNHDDACV